MPGCGKSTLGEALAARLGLAFMDTDEVLSARVGRDLNAHLNDVGDDVFLRDEEDAVCAVQAENTVIATGGSVVYSDRAMTHLKALGMCVYLEVEADRVRQRIEGSAVRPIVAFEHKNVNMLWKERDALCRTYADYVISNNTTPEEALQKLDMLRKKKR